MGNRQFKAESKRLLDLMINSIYTNKEIFLRELISNASDAIDKLYYRSLTDKKLKINKDDLKIRIDIDKENRLLTITDNGCGMTEEELDKNLGTIAKSGSLNFKQENEKKELIHKELPSLLHRILSIRLMPEMYHEELLKRDIEEIKKITNAECESALGHVDKLI